jgi:dTDP-4-amino-4,6-dideoxygalactose transaminase
MKVEFHRHSLNEQDVANVCDVLRSVFLTTGPVTAEFEQSFADYAGLRHVVGLNSCTAALHLALLALDIGPGDEVITTPMTFIASATAILHTGATPVFVDVEPGTGLLDVNRVEAAVTPRTKAILPVHLYGAMVDMKSLRTLADRYCLRIVEDSAHCVEGERDGIRPGQFSDASCYSFYATKNLTCGEGGALGCNDPDLAEKVTVLRLHGMSRNAITRYTGKYKHWDMIAEGWKYNMNDIPAALLKDQINRLDVQLARREELCTRYDAAFAGCPDIDLPAVPGKSARHLYTLWVDPDRRDSILHGLQERGVGVAVNFRSIHTLTFFRETMGHVPDDFPHALAIGQRTVTLPLYPGLTDQEADYVAQTVLEVVRG